MSSHTTAAESTAEIIRRSYHGLKEGDSVQISKGPGSPSDFDNIHKYGQDPKERGKRMDRNLYHSHVDCPTDVSNGFPIMCLPPEIRVQVWEIAVEDAKEDIIAYCHDDRYEFSDKFDGPWFTGKCFFQTYAKWVEDDLNAKVHKPLAIPGLNLLLTSRAVHDEVRKLVPRGRYLDLEAANYECASKVVAICPAIRTIAFPIPQYSNVLRRFSFMGKQGVQWWARNLSRYLRDFPDHSIDKVCFWTDWNGRPDPHIYHCLEFSDPEPGNERWFIRWTGSL